MGSFALDMSKFQAKSEKQLSQVVRKVSLGLFSAIIKSTPVDSGRARGAWMFSINRFDDTTPIDIRKESEAQSAIVAGLQTYKAGDLITLSNNLTYAEKLEYGWSKQAPAGMVRLNVQKFQTFINQANKGI